MSVSRSDLLDVDQPDCSCRACWRPLPTRAPGKAGRTREFCDDECRAAFHALQRAQDALALLEERCTPGAWLKQREPLWGALNARPWNRGVRRVALAAK